GTPGDARPRAVRAKPRAVRSKRRARVPSASHLPEPRAELRAETWDEPAAEGNPDGKAVFRATLAGPAGFFFAPDVDLCRARSFWATKGESSWPSTCFCWAARISINGVVTPTWHPKCSR